MHAAMTFLLAASTVTGRLDVHDGFLDTATGEAHRILVLLPPGYAADSARRYPVLYAFDGEDLFDAATAANGDEWALDELLYGKPAGIPEFVVVGLVARDPFEQAAPGSVPRAGGATFLDFVVRDVKPFVDRAYRTRPERDSTLLAGEGQAALAAVYGVWTHPNAFGVAIALGFPDLEPTYAPWTSTALRGPRPRLLVEQRGSSGATHASTTALVTALRRGADVDVLVSGSRAPRIVRLAGTLRRTFAE